VSVNPGTVEHVTNSPGFKTAAGTLTDPTIVRLRWRDPNGTETVWVFGTDTEVSNPSVGIYAADILASIAGTYVLRWEGEGAVDATSEGSFVVETLFDVLPGPSPRAALRYLTPLRYRHSGLGIDTSGKSDADLAAAIDIATYLVNAYTAAPTGHDFRGGVIVDEEHVWDVGNQYKPGSGRLWPYHRPITDATRLRLYVTRSQYIEFGADNLFFNTKLGYVEPVGTPSTTALFTSIPPWTLTAEVGKLSYAYGQEIPVVGEVPTITSDGLLLAMNSFWTDDAPTLKVAGDTIDPDDYTYDAEEGTVTINDGVDRTKTYRLDYVHTLPTAVARATSLIVTDLLGFSNINASGLTGLSGIRVEEIELRQSSKVGFTVDAISPAAKILLNPFSFASMA
jgi:hypothetical protein